KIIRPTFTQRSGLDFRKTTRADLRADQAIAYTVRILMNDHLPGIVRVQVIDKSRSAPSEDSHSNLWSHALGSRTKLRVIGKSAVLRLRDDGITAYASLSKIVGLEVPGSLVESETVEIIVRRVDKVEQIGNCRSLERPRIIPGQSVPKRKIKNLC